MCVLIIMNLTYQMLYIKHYLKNSMLNKYNQITVWETLALDGQTYVFIDFHFQIVCSYVNRSYIFYLSKTCGDG